MIKVTKNFNLLFYFIISIFYMEILLRLATTKDFLSLGIFISLLFSISLAIIYFIICSFFQAKFNYILSSFFLTITGIIFASQLVYYQYFRTFYTLYSAGNFFQVFTDFWQDILSLIIHNLFWVILFFIPTLLLFILRKRSITFNKIVRLHRIILICSIVLIHVLSLATISVSGNEQNSAYDLYFRSSDPVLSINKLGMITTMRLDLQRRLWVWPPVLSAPDIPAYIPVQTDETIILEEIEYNTLDIDFDELIAMEDSEIIKEMHNYFANIKPTSKNEYTGKYKGYNLILIVAESFSPYGVDKNITPTLYKMVNEGYNFTNFYVPSWDVSTSDGEYVTLTSLLPKSGVWSFTESAKIDLPFVMGNQLKELDYKTVAYHNHTYTYYNRNLSHPNMGYDYKGIGNGLNVTEIWPASDLEMMEETIPEYINYQPFHAYYLTVSGHKEYSFGGNNMARKNRELVQDLPYSEQAQAYLATQIELDKALGLLLEQLELAGIADKTLIALSTDHYPYGLDYETIKEFIGHEVEENFELYESNFILYTKGMDPVVIDKPSSSLDIIPTISNLLGLEYDSRLLMGRDIFSDSEPLVIFKNRSFITDLGKYNSLTQEFIPNEDTFVTQEYIEQISSFIDSKFYYSAKILETNYYDKIEWSKEDIYTERIKLPIQ